jgi:N-acetylmuramoyl-L-alanine amidase
VRTVSPDRLLLPLLLAALLAAGVAGPLGAQQKAGARPLVVVDAGHGGVDPGARGPNGEREKDVALAVAREVARLLREDPALEVRMTRDRDTLIALRDRPRMANRWRGDERPALFVSIHANAHRDRGARGFETYFLSEAKTEDARRVAEMENAAQQFEEDGAATAGDLGFILNDLRQNFYLRESSDWAELVQLRLAEALPGPDRGVKQASFVVLDGAFMPAVLVEMGFITNAREAGLLAARDGQRRIARGIAQAVRDFLARDTT